MAKLAGLDLYLAPDISGGKIVYTDMRCQNTDIFLYDLFSRKEKQITFDLSSQISPAISGRYLVWEDYRSAVSGIFLYDLFEKATRSITSGNVFQVKPDISGRVVFCIFVVMVSIYKKYYL